MEYKPKPKQKELKFIHITKCAGTFIEDIGYENNILWGRFHEEYGWWHEEFINKKIKLKEKYDWFVIVRNPYERILSEYYCKWGGIGGQNISHTLEEFNEYLIKKINNRNGRNKTSHYIEQHKYIDTNISSKIHIIKKENMYEELKKLFLDYDVKINISNYIEKKINQSELKLMDEKNIFKIKDFEPKLIQLVNTVYEKDFVLFGYDMI